MSAFSEWIESRASSTSRSGDHVEAILSCPECGAVGRFWVNMTTRKWTCYKCKIGGKGGERSTIALYMLVESVDRNEARLAVEKFDDALEADEDRALVPERHFVKTIPLPAEFQPLYDRANNEWTWPIYLTERNIDPFTALAFRLGQCRTGPYANRLVIPVTRNGAVVGWTARMMIPDPSEPKYLTAPGMDKGTCLFGLDQAFGQRAVVLVEGPFDALMLYQFGVSAVALQGKGMTFEQCLLLEQAGVSKIIVMLDSNDPTAWHAANEIARQRAWIFKGRTSVARLPHGLDPGSATKEQVKEALRTARHPTFGDCMKGEEDYEWALRKGRGELRRWEQMQPSLEGARARATA